MKAIFTFETSLANPGSYRGFLIVFSAPAPMAPAFRLAMAALPLRLAEVARALQTAVAQGLQPSVSVFRSQDLLQAVPCISAMLYH